MDGVVAPVVVAMASASAPFPENGAPFAAPDRSLDYGTSLIVTGEGYIVTVRDLATGCGVIVVPGLDDANRRVVPKADGLALLRVYGQHKLVGTHFCGGGAADVGAEAHRHSRPEGAERPSQVDRHQGATAR